MTCLDRINSIVMEGDGIPPLRAIVLDNDETTGSYGLLFAIISVLQNNTYLTDEIIKKILKRLATWMKIYNIFRPGILKLLYTALAMRKYKYIDAIIMYTNQTEVENSGLIIDSPPKCIAYMMAYLVEAPVFDNIITRDPNYKKTPLSYIPKSFERILELYPDRPKDIRGIIFVDDMASPTIICADTIEPHLKSKDNWYAICPYYQTLSYNDMKKCIHYIFEDILNVSLYTDRVWNAYIKYIPRGVSSITSVPLLHVCSVLKKKYSFVSYDKIPL
jgi:hypothetical protein